MGRTRAWLDILTKIGGVVAVLFAIQQYFDRQAKAKVERTLEYVALYVDGGGATAKAQQEITLRLTRASPAIRRLKSDMEAHPEFAQEARRRFVHGLLHGTDEMPGILAHQINLLQFFGSLEVCVASEVCDEETALAFFEGPVTDHWLNFCSFILENQDLDPDWGKNLQAFVARTQWVAPKGLNC